VNLCQLRLNLNALLCYVGFDNLANRLVVIVLPQQWQWQFEFGSLGLNNVARSIGLNRCGKATNDSFIFINTFACDDAECLLLHCHSSSYRLRANILNFFFTGDGLRDINSTALNVAINGSIFAEPLTCLVIVMA